jgi:cyclophilin family peptidyl-prolyl cis-trans isomerase
MVRNKIVSIFAFILITVLLFGCGEKKETTTTEKTESKTTENKTTTTTNTTKTDTSKTTQTQTTEKKDTTMESKTTEKEDSKKSTGNIAKIETNMGTIKVKLFTDKAPITTANFKKLVNEGFYNGIIFHRVIDGFMIQTGDPTGTGTGGSKEIIKDEFGPGLKFDKKGILAMANRGPNTGTSQFFITLAPTAWLDGKHAIFGEVIEGMDVVDKIGKTKVGPNDKPVTEVKMTKVTLTDK